MAPCKLSGLKIPYISNTLAEPGDGQNKDQRSSDTADQLSGALEGEYGGAHPGRSGTFIEIGPGKTLSGFLKKIDRNAVVYSIQTMEDLEKTVELLKGRNL